ncbi:MAG TPA: hypothetical protein VFI25_05405 [Planctomycetota bacterium]|nr:hypothetical protein [Planctomycetota bacterium]
MTRASRGVLLLALAPLAPLAPGSCEPTEVRVRTDLSPDGSCTREVVLRFPEAEEDGRKTGKPDVPAGLLLPEREAWPTWSFEKTALLARGFFAKASEIPADFRFRGRRDGRVVDRTISHRKEDFVFFERHRWSERFREPVDRDAMEASLVEAIGVAVEIGKKVLRDALEPDFDLAEVERWLDEEGTRTLRALVVLWWEGLRDPDPERTTRRVAGRLARAGVEVRPEELRDGEKLRAALARKVATLVRPPRPKEGRAPAALPVSAVENLLSAESLERFGKERIRERFGSKDAAEKWLADRHADLVGDLGGPEDKRLRFDCTLAMPGEVLRTNGVLLQPNEVLWRFTSGSLFPNGTTLEAESVVLLPHRLASLAGSKGVLTKRDVLDLIEALTDERGALQARAIASLEAGLEDRNLEKALARVQKVDGALPAKLREILAEPGRRKG